MAKGVAALRDWSLSLVNFSRARIARARPTLAYMAAPKRWLVLVFSPVWPAETEGRLGRSLPTKAGLDWIFSKSIAA